MSGENYSGHDTGTGSSTGGIDTLAESFFASGSTSDVDTSRDTIEGFAPNVVRPVVDEHEELKDDDFLLGVTTKYNVQIRDLGDEAYRLTEPLLITVEEHIEDDEVIASLAELELFADGVTESAAIAALKFEILDLYDELIDENRAGLGKKPQAWLRILKSIIIKDA